VRSLTYTVLKYPNGDDLARLGAASATRPRRRGGMLLVALVIVAAALGGLIYNGVRERAAAEGTLTTETKQAAAPFVEVVHPVGEAPDQKLALPGQTTAYVDTPIYARASGYLKSWSYDIGAHVKRGDVLAQIETLTQPAVARGAGATRAESGSGDPGGSEYGPRQGDERPHRGAGAARLDQPAAGRSGPAKLCGERRRADQRRGREPGHRAVPHGLDPDALAATMATMSRY
jgi:hypothetical protein